MKIMLLQFEGYMNIILAQVNVWLFTPGDLENEEEILEWLVDQLEKDEIEDVTDEMLDRLIKDGKTVAVLFCEYISWQ